MKQYHFVTTWFVEASAEAVFEALVHSEEWPQWWRGVTHVEELERGDERGIGNLRRYTFRSLLPYSLTFDVRSTLIDPPSALDGDATGDLVGTGRWALTPADGGVTVRYNWDVATNIAWMNALAPLVAPAFSWNHDVIMRRGEDGLREHLGLPPHEAAVRARAIKRWLTIGAGVAVALVATLRKWRRGRSRS